MVVTVNMLGVCSTNAAVDADVIVDACAMRRVNDWSRSGPTPFDAVSVSG